MTKVRVKTKMKKKIQKILIKRIKVITLFMFIVTVVMNGNILSGMKKRKIDEHYLSQLKD